MSSKKRKQQDLNKDISEDTLPSTPKLLSCRRCRARKVKCNFEYPCSSCIKVGAECVQTTNDMRKKRPPANYVSNLEKRINNLTSFFDKFKNLGSIEQKQALIDQTNLDNLLAKDVQEINTEQQLSQYYDSIEDRAVYGPTSVYDDNLITKNAKSFKSEESSIKILNKDPDILHCLKLFFNWQYPDHNMFIFREAFLIDFFDPKPNSLYCSKILVLSICALGSKMSNDDKIYKRSSQFYNEAKSLLLCQLDHPSIASLQSFLLLAFYDICNGSNSSGWMLSGNAMRMGYDLGFQLNPEVWFFKSKENLSPLDVAIRSRIYWGSYMADHFISLLLGRPSLLKMSDASIPETDDLPDLEWIDEYIYRGPDGKHEKDISYISNPLKKIINLINISDNMLNEIFTKSDIENDQSNNEDLNLASRLEKLYEYNAQIMNWKNTLPADLKWDKKSLMETAENPTLTGIRYYYYILILCLNRPFVGITKTFTGNNHDLSPTVICSNAIEDLYEAIHRFQSVHGLRRVSIFIVYCSILSISIILLTNTSKQLINEKKEKLQFFMEVLHGCSKTWKLAEKSYNLIKIKLESRYEYNDNDQSETNNSNVAKGKKLDNLSVIHEVKLQSSIQQPQMKESIETHQFSSAPQSEIFSYSQSKQQQLLHTIHRQQSNDSLTSSKSLTNPIEHKSSSELHNSIVESNTELLFDENLDFFGGPPVLMTSDLFNEDWESLFPDYIFNPKN